MYGYAKIVGLREHMDKSVVRPEPYFVGDHLAVDFLNTVAETASGPADWLADGADLVDWLERAGAIPPAVAAAMRAQANAEALDAVAARAREQREWLRGFLAKHGSGAFDRDTIADLASLNATLADDNSFARVVLAHAPDRGAHNHLALERVGRWARPDELLQPIAAAIADLLCREDLRLIRTCEGATCRLMFIDRTKAHGRRWCSMAVCGNRAKAAAHRARRRRA